MERIDSKLAKRTHLMSVYIAAADPNTFLFVMEGFDADGNPATYKTHVDNRDELNELITQAQNIPLDYQSI